MSVVLLLALAAVVSGDSLRIGCWIIPATMICQSPPPPNALGFKAQQDVLRQSYKPGLAQSAASLQNLNTVFVFVISNHSFHRLRWWPDTTTVRQPITRFRPAAICVQASMITRRRAMFLLL